MSPKKASLLKIYCLFFLILAILPSCQRPTRSTDPASLPLLNTSLAGKIPSDSPGFFIADFSSEAQAKYNARMQAFYSHFQTAIDQQLESHDHSDLVAQDSFLQVLSKLNATLFGSVTTAGSPGNIAQGVAFVSREPSGLLPLTFNLVSRVKKGVASSEVFFELTTILEEHKVDFAIQALDGREVVVLSTGSDGVQLPLYLSRENDLVAFSTNRNSLNRLLSSRSDNEAAGIKDAFSRKEVKRLAADISFAKNDNFIMFLDLGGILDTLKPYLAFLGIANTEIVSDLPIRYALARSEVTETSMNTAITIDAENALKDFSWKPRAKSSLMSHVKNDAILFFALDGALIQTIIDANGQDGAPVSSSLLNEIKALKTAGLGVSRGSGMFPEFFTILQLPNKREDTTRLIRSELAASLRGSGLPLSGWQEREVNGVVVHSMQSPLGIGAFVSQNSDLVYLATSETALKSLSEKKKSSLASRINANQSGSIAALFIDFKEIGNFVSSMEGLINMFTGGGAGAGGELKSQASALREMGNLYFSAGVDRGLIRADVRHSFE